MTVENTVFVSDGGYDSVGTDDMENLPLNSSSAEPCEKAKNTKFGWCKWIIVSFLALFIFLIAIYFLFLASPSDPPHLASLVGLPEHDVFTSVPPCDLLHTAANDSNLPVLKPNTRGSVRTLTGGTGGWWTLGKWYSPTVASIFGHRFLELPAWQRRATRNGGGETAMQMCRLTLGWDFDYLFYDWKNYPERVFILMPDHGQNVTSLSLTRKVNEKCSGSQESPTMSSSCAKSELEKLARKFGEAPPPTGATLFEEKETNSVILRGRKVYGFEVMKEHVEVIETLMRKSLLYEDSKVDSEEERAHAEWYISRPEYNARRTRIWGKQMTRLRYPRIAWEKVKKGWRRMKNLFSNNSFFGGSSHKNLEFMPLKSSSSGTCKVDGRSYSPSSANVTNPSSDYSESDCGAYGDYNATAAADFDDTGEVEFENCQTFADTFAQRPREIVEKWMGKDEL